MNSQTQRRVYGKRHSAFAVRSHVKLHCIEQDKVVTWKSPGRFVYPRYDQVFSVYWGNDQLIFFSIFMHEICSDRLDKNFYSNNL